MVRTFVFSALLTLSATPAFACINAMEKPEKKETPTRKAPEKKQKKQQAEPTVTAQNNTVETTNYALLGLAGAGLAGLTGAYVLRSRA